MLKEDLDEQSFNFQKFNISKPGVLPGSQGGDESGEELTNVFEKLLDDVQSKKESINLELSKANDEVTKLQLAVSEASALLSQDRRSLTSKQARMEQLDGAGGSISKIRGVMEELQKYENGNNIATPAAIDISRPKEFLNYLSSRLEEEEAQSLEGVQPDVVRKIILRLKKQVGPTCDYLGKNPLPLLTLSCSFSFITQAKGGNSVACPCCTRDFTAPEEIETFQNQMQLLGGDKTPLLKGDETSQSARSLYQEWRNVVADNMNGVLDYRRLANEVNELETRMMELESAHKTKTEQFEKEKGAASDFEMEEKDIHEILDATKRYIDAAKRISQKRIEVNQKQIDLSMSHSDFGGRDLRTVERELQDRLDKKDQHSNMVRNLEILE